MSEMLFCVNKNSFYHEDRFNGVLYQFHPGEKVMVPLDAAQHMFGVGVADKTPVMHRLGWGFVYDPDTKQFRDDKEGPTKLKNFVFTKAVVVEQPAMTEVPVEGNIAT